MNKKELKYNISKFLQEKKGKPHTISLSKKKYNFPLYYINRKVVSELDIKYYSFYEEDKYGHDLIDIILKEKRIVLLSNAGDGKTTELQNIANYFSLDETTLYPVYKSFNKYINKSIETIINEEWNEFSGWIEFPEDKLLIIIDGFDEIEPKNRHTAQRQIEDFCDNHPNVHILISSRTNFYTNPDENYSGTLKRFKVFQLCELKANQIIDYVNKQQNQYTWVQVEKFVNENFDYKFLTSPFHLVNFTKYINYKSELPKSKAVIFEYLIQAGINKDIEKFRTVFTYPIEKLKEVLDRLAFIMERLCRNFLKENELFKILPDENERDLLKYTNLWQINENKFIHNNYQEFLAAKSLSNLSFEEIKEIITFSPENEVVNPSWSNTISFLISLLDKKDKKSDNIFELIKESNPNIIIKAEPGQINDEIRNKLFIDLFIHYKSKKLFFSLNYVTHWELIRFCNTRDIIKFLIKEIEKENIYIARLSAIYLLSHLQNYYIYEGEIKTKLVSFIYDKDEAIIIISKSIDIIAKNELLKLNDIKRIIEKFEESGEDDIITSLIRLINLYKLNEEYVPLIIKAIEKAEQNFISPDKAYSIDLEIAIKEAVKKLETENSVKIMLDWFNKNQRNIHYRSLTKEVFDLTIDISITLYSNRSKTIFDTIYDFLKAIAENFYGDDFDRILHFFKKTQTQIDAVYLVLQWGGNRSIEFSKLDIIYRLMDDEEFGKIFNYIFNKFENKELNKEFMSHFQNEFRRHNHPKLNFINQKLIEIDKDYFEIEERPDFEKTRDEIQQKDLKNILDKKYWNNEINKIYSMLKQDNIAFKDLCRIYSFDPKNTVSKFAHDFLLTNSRTSSISKEKSLSLIEKNFKWILIHKFYELLINYENLELNEEHKEWIKKWCEETISQISFKKSISGSKTGYRRNTYAYYIEFFMVKFQLSFNFDKMLEMLSSIIDWDNFDYVVRTLHIQNKIKTQGTILSNLKNGIEVQQILINHINYCSNYRLTEILPYCYDILTLDDSTDVFLNDMKSASFSAIKELSDDNYAKLKEVIYNIRDNFKWKIIDDFIKNDIEKEFVVKFLIDMTEKENEDDAYEASEKLITLQHPEGFEYFYNYIKKHKKWRYQYWRESPFKKITEIKLIDCILKLLDLYLYEDIKNVDEYDSFLSNIEMGFTSIALQSDENYELVNDKIQTLLDNSKDIPEKKISNINYYLNTLKDEFYRNKAELINLDDIIG